MPGEAETAAPARREERPGFARRNAKALTVVGLLAFIAVAGVRVLRQLEVPLSPSGIVQMVRGGSEPLPATGDVPNTIRSFLLVHALPAAKDGAGRVAISLQRPQFYSQALDPNAIQPALSHEIIRQALLDAARDGLGALTRDGSLGESPPEGEPLAKMELATTVFPWVGPPRVSLSRVTEERREEIWAHDLPPTTMFDQSLYYPKLVEQAEVFIRDEFPQVFAKLGLKGRPVAWEAEGRVPEGVEDRLARMTFFEQFAAVRALEAAIRSDGATPDRVGALVRGYAHLGTLTESHWNAGHKAFKARSLIEAQRLVARDPRSPAALRHRAYARTLVGMHKDAIADLATARTLAEASPGAAKPPDWVDMSDALCRFDTKRLTDARDGPQGQLAMFLAFLSVEQSRSAARTLKLARELLEQNPECYRVYDSMCETGGVSTLHRATLSGMEIFSNDLRTNLKDQPGLPASVATILKDAGVEAKVTAALIDAGGVDDDNALSWGALGRLIREARFVQVWHRARFMANVWSVPVDDFLAESRPLIADHPYRALVEGFGSEARSQPATSLAKLLEVEIPDIELTEFGYMALFDRFDPSKKPALWREALLHDDHIYRDQAMVHRLGLPTELDGQIPVTAGHVEQTSPHAPLIRAERVLGAWDSAEPHAAEWEAAAGQQPDVLAALGRRYVALQRWDDARRCLSKSLDLSPDADIYGALAKSYKEQGDFANWQATLDRFIEREEDYGLEHARTRVEIAQHFMRLKQWNKAQPYAEAAAQSWAEWAMRCAAECYEGMQEWEQSELWVRRISERYPNTSWANWFLWCHRTGQGNLDVARRGAERHARAMGERSGGGWRDMLGYLHLLSGEPKEALDDFRNGYRELKVMEDGMGAIAKALLADQLGDLKLRDETLERVCIDFKDTAPKTIRVCQMFRDVLSRGKDAQLDLAAVDPIIESASPVGRETIEFFVGWFVKQHGNPAAARVYLRRCAASPNTYVWFRSLAVEMLRADERDQVEVEPRPGVEDHLRLHLARDGH